MNHDDFVSNKSGNRPFQEVLESGVSRRGVLAGGLATATSAFFCTSHWNIANAMVSPTIGFEPVLVADGNGPVPVISSDYEYSVLIPWGDPIEPSGPAFSYPPNATDQAQQIGIGHDGMTYFPLSRIIDFKDWSRLIDFRDWRGGDDEDRDDFWEELLEGLGDEDDDGDEDRRRRWRGGRRWIGNRRGLLAINHEFGRNSHVLGKSDPTSLGDVRTSQHAHGVAIVEIRRRRDGTWRTVNSPFARRIHANTPVVFSGPVAGHPILDTPAGNEPQGTVNNCSNGETPWRTYLTCEENFNGYFGATDPGWTPTAEQDRYGFDNDGFNYGWELFDPRFDLSNPHYTNEENRFGWVVEIDPFRPHRKPVKRTALGRFKHEGATTVVGKRNRIVVYMGDDQRFDYIYKFVSSTSYKRLLRRRRSPLDHGKLYVAKFNDDFTGDWLELTIDNPALAAEFADQAEVLTYARKAADILGATPMDRPEWATVAPDGQVYMTLTNNSQRGTGTNPGADAANPLAPNADGHIIRWFDSEKHTGLTFTWDIFLISEDTHGTEESFSDPDGIHADPDGRLFIETDGGQKDGLNNQLLVADTHTGALRRLLTGVTGDEITGVAVTPNRRTMFVNLQHPGNGNPTLTNFPVLNDPPDGTTVPRDATLVITRKDGGIIGS